MVDKPTAEQVAEARAVAERVVSADCVAVASPAEVKAALRTLLAATEPPTDETLAREFTTLIFGREPSEADVRHAVELIAEGSLLNRVNIYVAGARRENCR